MAKGNMLYKVVVYVGGLSSHNTQVIHICSKESEAEKRLHEYIKGHPEVCKAYIEREFNTRLNRNKFDYDEED